MPLALRFEPLLKNGTVKHPANLSRPTHISRARVTQIMDLLLHLARRFRRRFCFCHL